MQKTVTLVIDTWEDTDWFEEEYLTAMIDHAATDLENRLCRENPTTTVEVKW